MKQLLIIVLALILAFNCAFARKSSKAGEFKDGVYTDNLYNFSLNIPDDWNYSIKKDDSNTRLVLTKKTYDVPLAFQSSPNFTKIPTITVYADTSSMSPEVFTDSLMSDAYKSKQKKQVMNICEILYGEFTKRKQGKMSVGEISGILIAGEQKYTLQIPDVYTNYYGGSIFIAKHGNNLMIVHFISENLYYQNLNEELIKVLSTLKFTEPEKGAKE